MLADFENILSLSFIIYETQRQNIQTTAKH